MSKIYIQTYLKKETNIFGCIQLCQQLKANDGVGDIHFFMGSCIKLEESIRQLPQIQLKFQKHYETMTSHLHSIEAKEALNKPISLEHYILENFDQDTVKAIAKQGFMATPTNDGEEVDTIFLFDNFMEEIWDYLYLSAERQRLSIAHYLCKLLPNKYEIDTLDGFKNLMTQHAIEQTAKGIIARSINDCT